MSKNNLIDKKYCQYSLISRARHDSLDSLEMKSGIVEKEKINLYEKISPAN